MLQLLFLLFTALVTALVGTAASAAPSEPLWVELGPANHGQGLSVPSDGDGVNGPAEFAGKACRRIAGGQSLYLYVQVDRAVVPPGRYDAYVTVEYFDGAPGMAQVQYDRVAPGGGIATAYSGAGDVLLMLGTGKWQRAILHLPDARFGHGQNFGADFRLCGNDVAVRRIEVQFTRPAGYHEGGVDPKAMARFRTRIGSGMELTFGNDAGPGQATLFRALGVTSVESYVTWQTVENRGKGQWDWSHWDRQVSVLQHAGLKWVPFLIAGSAYANPQWFRESEESVPYVCLEHGQPSKVQSIWSPHLRAWVDRFLKEFAQRYGQKGVIESVLLGVTGIYGESIYPAGPEGGWTADIPGFYHNHGGWWAGDPYAAADFRRAMQHRYGTIAALNRAWRTQHASFEAVKPFLPEKAASPRARADLVAWYTRAMTDWATFWVATTRKYLPKTEIYLCTGGDGNPFLGADFSAQAKAISPYKAGIRITNEGSSYAANFAITREVATATRAFGTYCGFEPASGVDANGVIARIYNATASGARQLQYYTGNVTGSGAAVANFRRYASFLQARSPQIYAGVYLPKVSWALDPGGIGRLYDAARSVRDRLDIEFVDRASLGAPGLSRVRVLGLAEAPYAEAGEVASLRKWVEAGGIAVALAEPDQPLLRTPDGDNTARASLFAAPPKGLELARIAAQGAPPKRFRLDLGRGGDGDYLSGDWYGQEGGGEWAGIPGATKRWSGARPVLHLPIDPGAEAVLTLDAYLSSHSLPGPNRVLVNGTAVGVVDQPGTHTYRFPVPRAALAGRPVADVALEVQTWKPSDYGQGDGRDLGLALRQVEICARGAEAQAPGKGSLRVTIDWEQARKLCVRRVGKGATLLLPASGGRGAWALAEAMVQAVQHPETFVSGAKGVTLPAPAADRVYTTQTAQGVLFYNANGEPTQVGGVQVPAHGIAWKARPASRRKR